jgi:glycogen operon protein
MADHSHTLAYALHGATVGDRDLYVMISAYHEPLTFEIQEGRPGDWLRVVDTARESPDDIAEPGHEPPVNAREYRVEARSVVVLMKSS